MKRIIYTGRAKKDLKKIQNDPVKVRLLSEVLFKLSRGEKLDASLRAHHLVGNYSGCMECHIQGDFLLIWIDEEYIEVVRVGSHSELF